MLEINIKTFSAVKYNRTFLSLVSGPIVEWKQPVLVISVVKRIPSLILELFKVLLLKHTLDHYLLSKVISYTLTVKFYNQIFSPDTRNIVGPPSH